MDSACTFRPDRRGLRLLVLGAVLVPAGAGLAGVVVGANLALQSLRPADVVRGQVDRAPSARMAGYEAVVPSRRVALLEFAPPPDSAKATTPEPEAAIPLPDRARNAIAIAVSDPSASVPAPGDPAPVPPDGALQPSGSTPLEAAAVASTPRPASPEPVRSAPASTESDRASTVQAGSAGRFAVQAGVFASRANAETLREQLRRRGLDSRVEQGSGAAAFRVVVGRYATWREAERARRALGERAGRELFSRRLALPRPAPALAAL